MNSGDNSFTLHSRKIVQELANRSSFEGVETGGRFVQHNAAGV
jgi:hypothetical protein